MFLLALTISTQFFPSFFSYRIISIDMLCPSSKKRKEERKYSLFLFKKSSLSNFFPRRSREKGFLNLSSSLRRFGEKGGRDKETKRRAVLSNNRSNDRWTNFGSVKNGGEGWENAGCQAIPYWSFNESTTLSRNPPRVASSKRLKWIKILTKRERMRTS